MFNPNLKEQYLNTLSRNEASKVEGLFNYADRFEQTKNLDLCNWATSEYMDLIMSYSKGEKGFSSFYESNMRLLKYRRFCVLNHYIDEVEYYKNYDRDDKPNNIDKLYSFYNKNMSMDDIKYDPNMIYTYFKKIYSDIKPESKGSGVSVNYTPFDSNNKMSYRWFCVMLMIIVAYGVNKKDISNIKRSDFTIEQDEIILTYRNQKIKLYGISKYMVQDCLNSRIIQGEYQSKAIYLDEEYVFTDANCKSQDDREKCIKKYFAKLSKDRYDADIRLPSAKVMCHWGVIRRICQDTADQKITSDKTLFKFYKNYIGFAPNGAKCKSVVEDYNEMYNNLDRIGC